MNNLVPNWGEQAYLQGIQDGILCINRNENPKKLARRLASYSTSGKDDYVKGKITAGLNYLKQAN